MAQFHHFGVQTQVQQPNEEYLEGAKVYITDPEAHPYRFEYLRFEPGTPLPTELQTMSHIAFTVDNLDKAIEGEKVIVPPFDAKPTVRAAFIMKDNTLIELMQLS